MNKIDPKSLTQEENDKYFFHINRRLLKATYEHAPLDKICELIESRMKLKTPENLIKRNTFDPDMDITMRDILPKWWHDTLRAARGRQYEEKQDEFGEGYR